MSILYDSKQRKTRWWVLAILVSIPIMLITALVISTKDIVEKENEEKEESSIEVENIFEK